MVAPSLTSEQEAALLDQLLAERARRHLKHFALRVMPDGYEQPAQVAALLEALEAVERGELKRLIVTEPPRSSKSTHVSRIFPADYLGKHANHGVIIASYGQELATGHGRAVRDTISSPQYPHATKLRADVKAAGRWQTDAGGGLLAAGVGTGLTGFGGHVLVADDLIKGREEAESEIVREHTWNWHEEVFMTRLQKGGAVIETGTRWHEDDPIGRILNSKSQAQWYHLNIPYEAEADDVLGRAIGEKLELFGEVPPDLSAYAYSALYQQRPSPAGGGVFKADWMQRRYCIGHNGQSCRYPDARPLPTGGRFTTIQSADLGGKQGVGHDPSAIATWGWDGISKYLLDYWSSQAEYADVKAVFKAKNWEHRPRMLYVEDATWAQPLISDLRRESGIKVHAVPSTASKWIRADAVSPEFEGGLVVLPCTAPFLDGWLAEHLSFPNGVHDEAVDTTSLALSVLKNAPQRTRTLNIVETGSPDRTTKADRMRDRIRSARRGVST